MIVNYDYDVIVVGGGHAGVEACLASAKLNKKTLLITLNFNMVANMPCNPSIGGTAKGIVVREIDAMGGLMGKVADKTHIECDTLILDSRSKSDTIPKNECFNNSSFLEHEATVSKINEDQLFYLMSRGISKKDAIQMIVMGFIEPFSKELPMEYAVELNQLIKLDMDGSVG